MYSLWMTEHRIAFFKTASAGHAQIHSSTSKSIADNMH